MNWKLLNRVWHANLGMLSILTLGIIALSCPFIAHHGNFALGKALMKIHYGEFIGPQWRWLWIDSQGLLLGFLVFSGMMMHRKTVKQAANMAADDPTAAGSSVTVLGAGATALTLATEGEQQGLRIFRCEEANYGKLRLELERWLVIPTGAARALLGCVQALKVGQLKRLQCFVQDGPDSAAVVEALAEKSATILAINASEATWHEAVLQQLAQHAEKKKPVAASRVAKLAAASAGFTLLEMLISIGIFAMLVGGAASALKSMAHGQKLQQAATDLVALIREARSTALREGTWVRIAFMPDHKEVQMLKRGEVEQQRMGCALLVLRRPATLAPAAQVIQPTAVIEGNDSPLTEVVSTSRVPLPASLLAGWDFPRGHERWNLWDASVKLSSSVLGDYTGDEAAAAPQTYLWQPELVWNNTKYQHVDAPPDSHLTPTQPIRSLICEPFAETEQVPVSATETVPAKSIWGSFPVLHWTSSQVVSAEFLPALDFQPNGSLCCAAKHKQLTFKFQHRTGQLEGAVTVQLNTTTGEARVL